jgi:hypothetical protein
LDDVRSGLLSAIATREAVQILDAIQRVGLMVDRAGRRGETAPLFAAAELARDSLGSPLLARELFLLYAGRERGGAFEGKALLAALQLSEGAEARSPILDRLDEIPNNSYLVAARRTPGGARDFTALERRLQGLIEFTKQQVAVEAQTRDVQVRDAARAFDSIRRSEDIRRRVEAGDSALIDSLRIVGIQRDSIRLDSILDSLQVDSVALDSILRDSIRIWDSIRRGGDTIPPQMAWLRPTPVLIHLKPIEGKAGSTR